MTVKHRTDYIAAGQKKLLSLLRKPRNLAILASRLRGFQRIEDAAHEVAEHLNLTKGFGVILDNIGALVGRGRGTLSDDEDYKRVLRAQIRANRSQGNPKDTIEVASLYLNDDLSGDGIIVTEYTAAYTVEFTVDDFPEGPLAELLETARPLGVGGTAIVAYTPGEELLWGWSGGSYDAADGAVHGLAWSGATPGNGDIGGYTSRSIEL